MKLTHTFFLCTVTLGLAACGGSGSVDVIGAVDTGADTENLTAYVASRNAALTESVVKQGEPVAASALSASDLNFDFPEVMAGARGYTMTIPDAPLPGISSRRYIEEGPGQPVVYGDTVVLNWDMYSWSTGEIVNSSADLEEPLAVVLGEKPLIPAYLEDSMVNRKDGSTIQVVFEPGTQDLPIDLDTNDSYVLLVKFDKQ